MADRTSRHFVHDEEGQVLSVPHVRLARRVRLTIPRLLRTWSGRAVFAAGLIWLPVGIGLIAGVGQDQRLLASLLVLAFGCFVLVLCGWRRYDDPAVDARQPGKWGVWDWRPDSGIVAGLCLVIVGLVGSLL